MQSLLILKNLIHNETYARAVIPYLKDEYFHDRAEKQVFKEIEKFFVKYNSLPTTEALTIGLNDSSISDDIYKESLKIIDIMSQYAAPDNVWLMESTEEFCQMMAIQNAVMKCVAVISDEKQNRHSMRSIIDDALAVSFDNTIGHNFIDDADERYKKYHAVESKIPFRIDILNDITNGGVSRKTLNMLMAGTGGGKTIGMCSLAADNLMDGWNVLYITMEMSEIRIAERIDANLMNCDVDKLVNLSPTKFSDKVSDIASKTKGRLIIKEYPTGSAHSGHIRHLLNELRTKKKFVPDVVYLDYINLCASSRLKMGGAINTYSLIKAVAEEIRGLAVEYDYVAWSATQTNRSGFNNSDAGLEHSAESFGLPATSDLFLLLFSSPELDALNQIMCKQLKNRYADKNKPSAFVIGLDKPKMRFYNLEKSAQTLTQIDMRGSVPTQDGQGQQESDDLGGMRANKKKYVF